MFRLGFKGLRFKLQLCFKVAIKFGRKQMFLLNHVLNNLYRSIVGEEMNPVVKLVKRTELRGLNITNI